MIPTPNSGDIIEFHELIDADAPDLEAIASVARKFRTWIRDGNITIMTAYSGWQDASSEIKDTQAVFLTREALRHPRLKELGIDTSIPARGCSE